MENELREFRWKISCINRDPEIYSRSVSSFYVYNLIFLKTSSLVTVGHKLFNMKYYRKRRE